MSVNPQDNLPHNPIDNSEDNPPDNLQDNPPDNPQVNAPQNVALQQFYTPEFILLWMRHRQARCLCQWCKEMTEQLWRESEFLGSLSAPPVVEDSDANSTILQESTAQRASATLQEPQSGQGIASLHQRSPDKESQQSPDKESQQSPDKESQQAPTETDRAPVLSQQQVQSQIPLLSQVLQPSALQSILEDVSSNMHSPHTTETSMETTSLSRFQEAVPLTNLLLNMYDTFKELEAVEDATLSQSQLQIYVPPMSQESIQQDEQQLHTELIPFQALPSDQVPVTFQRSLSYSELTPGQEQPMTQMVSESQVQWVPVQPNVSQFSSSNMRGIGASFEPQNQWQVPMLPNLYSAPVTYTGATVISNQLQNQWNVPPMPQLSELQPQWQAPQIFPTLPTSQMHPQIQALPIFTMLPPSQLQPQWQAPPPYVMPITSQLQPQPQWQGHVVSNVPPLAITDNVDQQHLQSQMPPSEEFHPSWQEPEQQEGILNMKVTRDGLISVQLKNGVSVSMTLDNAIYISNVKTNVFMAINSSGESCSVVNSFGRVHKSKNHLVQVVCEVPDNNNKIAMMRKSGISFTNKRSPLVYILDDGGVRTTCEKFLDLGVNFVLHTFYESKKRGPQFYEEANELSNTAYKFMNYGVEYFNIGDIQISHSPDGLVGVFREGERYEFRTSYYTGVFTVNTPSVYMTGKDGPKPHLFVRYTHLRIFYDKENFQVRNKAQAAGFDKDNQLVVKDFPWPRRDLGL